MFELMEQNLSTKQNIKLSTANTSEENIYILCFQHAVKGRTICMYGDKPAWVPNVGKCYASLLQGTTNNVVRKTSANIQCG